jgi:folate-dependent phosphoribosylglycinamide formyltransferase PurN
VTWSRVVKQGIPQKSLQSTDNSTKREPLNQFTDKPINQGVTIVILAGMTLILQAIFSARINYFLELTKIIIV